MKTTRFETRCSAPDHDGSRAVVEGRCMHRDPGDDFFCLRYQVWYASFDCAVRTRYRTSPGCRNCEQGRFNLRRHAASLGRPNRALERVLGE